FHSGEWHRLGRIVDQWCARTHGREDGWNERGARLFFAGRFAAKQRVVFGGDFPGGLDASVFPQGGSPIVQFHWASVLLVLQPPFGLLAQPPLEGVHKFGGVGHGPAAPLVLYLPLFVPAALVDGLLDAPDMLVISD